MFAISCTSGPVFTFIEPFVSQLGTNPMPDILTDCHVFKSNLTSAFGDSDPIVTAETQLRRLYQDNSSASFYATRFRIYAQSVEWNDAALMSQFKVNLSQAIQKNELARRPSPTTFELLIAEAIDIDNKIIKGPRERRILNKTMHPWIWTHLVLVASVKKNAINVFKQNHVSLWWRYISLQEKLPKITTRMIRILKTFFTLRIHK